MTSANQPLLQKLFTPEYSGAGSLPHMAFPPPSDAVNRICVVISDIHCTDGTVGNQSGEGDDWQRFFQDLRLACRDHDELVLVLNGDIIDLVRSAAWTEAGVYPWDRDHARFAELVNAILDGIIRLHATPFGLFGQHGFFEQLKRLRPLLQADGTAVRIIPIVGNHDKELLLVASARQRFYRDCLGWTDSEQETGYRDWIAAMYGAGKADEPPWLPFYFGDRGFKLFATHGQWRDNSNSRAQPGWRAGQGWHPGTWQGLGFSPFTAACFGDTVAAGLLSGFIHDTKRQLRQLDVTRHPVNARAITRLNHILDEMDLYRPAVAGIVRILQEARLQRGKGVDEALLQLISGNFRASLRRWLAQPVSWRSAPAKLKLFLPVLALLGRIKADRITLGIMKLMAKVQEPQTGIGTLQLLALPGFQKAYREEGFRIHTEGHTHVPLEADLQFEQPADQPNYSYINTGAWRSQIMPKQNYGYRRRGVGRALYVYDRLDPATASRRFGYYLRDAISWCERSDWGGGAA
ncbi:metallophosphoesterase [Chitinimonas arctica]|nr:metallophosphoesterase [Chitinimonas arctica]